MVYDKSKPWKNCYEETKDKLMYEIMPAFGNVYS